MPIYYIMSCMYDDNDHSDKKVNKHICHGYSVPLLLLVYPMSLSAELLNNFLFKIITTCIYTCRKSFTKKGQKQVKKKAFK